MKTIAPRILGAVWLLLVLAPACGGTNRELAEGLASESATDQDSRQFEHKREQLLASLRRDPSNVQLRERLRAFELSHAGLLAEVEASPGHSLYALELEPGEVVYLERIAEEVDTPILLTERITSLRDVATLFKEVNPTVPVPTSLQEAIVRQDLPAGELVTDDAPAEREEDGGTPLPFS